jgi:respiratory burst oxidase
MGTEMSESKRIAYSSPLKGPLNKPNSSSTAGNIHSSKSHVEISMEVCNESVAVESVQTTAVVAADPVKDLQKRTSFGSSIVRSASERIKKELKRFTSSSKLATPTPTSSSRTKSTAAYALKGLKFISQSDRGVAMGWSAVEKQFDKLTSSTNASLPRSLFGKCIGSLYIIY